MLLAGEGLAAYLDLLTRESGIETIEGGALALILILQLGAVEHSEDLALGHGITRMHGVAHSSWSYREQRRVDRRDDDSLRGDIAHEMASLHGRCAEPLAGHDVPRVRPGVCKPDQDADQGDGSSGSGVDAEPAPPCRARALDLRVLGFRAPHRCVRGRVDGSFQLCESHFAVALWREGVHAACQWPLAPLSR